MRRERWVGSYLTDNLIEKLDGLLELSEAGGVVEGLRNRIYDLTVEEIKELKEKGRVDLERVKLGRLRDEQTIGVAYMFYAKRLLLGDSTGLGKTAQVAGLINIIRELRGEEGSGYLYFTKDDLLVEEASRKLRRFTGQNVIEVKSSEKKEVKKLLEQLKSGVSGNIVGTHMLLKNKEFREYMKEHRRRWCLLVVDESSVLGNRDSDYYKIFEKEWANKYDYMIFLNATPAESSLEVFYNQLRLLAKDALPTVSKFYDQFVVLKKIKGRYVRSGFFKNEAYFKEQIRYLYLARTRKSLGAKIEDCKGYLYKSALSAEQKKWERQSTMYGMIYTDPTYFEEGLEYNEETVGKLADTCKILEDVGEERVLLYCWYAGAQEKIVGYLRGKGYKVEMINGSVIGAERQRLLDEYRSGGYQILVTNVQRGLDLEYVKHCIIYTFSGNPSEMVQLEGRMVRDFDIEGITLYVLVSQGREVKKMRDVIAKRAEMLREATEVDYSIVLDMLMGIGEIENKVGVQSVERWYNKCY